MPAPHDDQHEHGQERERGRAPSHGHTHGHSHDDDRPLAERLRSLTDRRVLLGAVIAIAVLTVVGLVALWPGAVEPVTDLEGESFFGERVEADVEEVRTADCSFASEPGEFTCDTVSFVVTTGTPQGDRGELELPLGAGGPRIQDGDRLVLYFAAAAPEGAQYQFADFQRSTPMLLLAALFVAAVVAFGRWRGLFAIVGVAVSMVVLVGFTLPALLDGGKPLWVALTATAAVALPALYLAHGLSEKTSVAVLGTVASLLLTCVLGSVFIGVTRLTGLADESVGFLQAFGGRLDFSGLLLAGLVIGALGVLDDVTVTQVAAVWELHEAKPEATAKELYDAGVRIGRDHIASTVNTLVLAYAGASLPLLLLFRTAGQRLGDVITSESIAAEVVRALVGSIGLVASVPITTGLAALVVTRRVAERATAARPSDDGDRDEPALPERRTPSRRARPTAPSVRAPEPERTAPSWDDFGPADDRDR